MAIYLAILDENPADRKQAERLLCRESSRISEKGDALYYESFGKEDAFLPFLEKYDLVFIDVSDPRDGMMVALDLIKKGCECPVFLCSGKTDYKEKYGNDPRFDFENLHYLKKPLREADYRESIELASKQKKSHRKKVELRSEEGTLYIFPEEILYIIETKGIVTVTLNGDRSFHSFGRINDILMYLPDDLNGFLMISKNTVINMREVVSVSGNSFKMSNGAIIRFSFLSKPGIIRHWEEWNRRKRSE